MSGCMLLKPSTIMNKRGRIFKPVVTTWNAPLPSMLRIFIPITLQTSASETSKLRIEEFVIAGMKTPR